MSPQTSQSTLDAIKKAVSDGKLTAAAAKNLDAWLTESRYKDYADDNRSKTMTLSAEEFLRRFVQHVLPRGFVKIRHYGLLANRQRADKLTLCRRLLAPQLAAAQLTAAAADGQEEVAPAQPQRCPQCGGCRLLRIELDKEGGSVPTQHGDTS